MLQLLLDQLSMRFAAMYTVDDPLSMWIAMRSVVCATMSVMHAMTSMLYAMMYVVYDTVQVVYAKAAMVCAVMSMQDAMLSMVHDAMCVVYAAALMGHGSSAIQGCPETKRTRVVQVLSEKMEKSIIVL